MRHRGSLILHVTVRLVVPIVLVVAVFLLFAGHNAPGGGFIGGLVAGGALTLRFIDEGPESLARSVRLHPATITGAGIVVALASGLVPLIAGNTLFETVTASADVPGLGKVKVTSALTFDIGVFLVVTGLVVTMLSSFGREVPDPTRPPETSR